VYVHTRLSHPAVEAPRDVTYGPRVKHIGASILAADFGHLADEVRTVQDAGADWNRVDIIDGHFVPTWHWARRSWK